MKLHVQYTAQLRTAVGRMDEEVELPESSSLAALVSHLADRLGREAASHLITPTGQTQCGLLIVVNGSAITAHQSAATVLRTGDVVTLLAPIAGG